MQDQTLRDPKGDVPKALQLCSARGEACGVSSSIQTRCLKATSALQADEAPSFSFQAPPGGSPPAPGQGQDVPQLSWLLSAVNPTCLWSCIPLKSTAASLHPDITLHSWLEAALGLACRSPDSGDLCAKGPFLSTPAVPGYF